LTLYGPVTKSNPLSNCFKNTTRFPLNLPANKIKTVPGVMDALSFVCFAALRDFLGCLTSSAG
jgi:hypothetical protein